MACTFFLIAQLAPSAADKPGMPHEELQKRPVHDAIPKSPPKFKTGDKYIDEGPRCERDGEAGLCFLDQHQRGELIGSVRVKAHICVDAYRDALNDSRIEGLLQKDTGWGFVGDLLFNLLSATMMSGWGFIAARVARELVVRAAWNSDQLPSDLAKSIDLRRAWLAATGTGALASAKAHLVQSTAGYPREASMKIAFIDQLRSEAHLGLNALIDELQAEADDLALLLAKGAYDPTILTLGYFQGEVQTLLARFDSAGLAKLGPTKTGPVQDGTRSVVRFTSGARTRLAVVEERSSVHLGRSHGDDWETSGGASFVSWVDSDLGEAALSLQSARVGDVRTIDAAGHDALAQATEVRTWAHDPWGGAP